MAPVLQLPSVLLLLLLAVAPLDARQISRCPSGDLMLTVPEDLPGGTVLLSWDPTSLTVKSSLDSYKRVVHRSLNHISAGARAFFSEGLEDAISVATAEARATLVKELAPRGPNIIMGRSLLECVPVAGGPGTPQVAIKFRVHLRILRQPLRLWAVPLRPLLAPGYNPAGAILTNVSAFSYGRRVTPSACTASADASTSATAAILTVDADDRVALAAPFDSSADDDEWTATVTCEWRGLKAHLRLTVAPLRLWRRRHSRVTVASTGDASALAGARIRLSLDALLARPGPRVRLVGSSDSRRVHLVTATSGLLVDLASDDDPLTVKLEAIDAEGRTETASLQILGGPSANPAPCTAAAAAFPWWLAPLLAVAAAALCLACAWPALHRRLRRGQATKPQFV